MGEEDPPAGDPRFSDASGAGDFPIGAGGRTASDSSGRTAGTY